MTLSEPNTYKQVIGCLMKSPVLKEMVSAPIEINDFDTKITRLLFDTVKMFIENGAASITVEDVDIYLSTHEIYKKIYEQNNGLTVLQDAIAIANVENFKIYYSRLKKLSLLRNLKKQGYSIDYFYRESFTSLQEEKEYIKRFEEATCASICDKVESNFALIREKFLAGEGNGRKASDGVRDLVEEYKRVPAIGQQVLGEYMNTVLRGACLGRFVVRSATTNAGKSRLAFADLCYLAIPEYYDSDLGRFVHEDREPGKALIITTEMEAVEVQTILLAFIADVNEEEILNGRYSTKDNEKRVEKAIEILEKYSKTFFIEEISNPDLNNIQATVKKYALLHSIEYCCYDYIFTSPALIAQFQESGLREDVVLTMLSTQLKELAKEYGIFMLSATQLNAEGTKWDGPKDQTAIRGAKGIADKVDIGIVISKVSPQEEKFLSRIHASDFTLKSKGKPTHVFDVYKLRRGRYKNVRIWSIVDLGTGRRKDLFMTNQDGSLVEGVQILERCGIK